MSDLDKPMIELPRYKCHKEVWALKIKGFDVSLGETNHRVMVFEDSRYKNIKVTHEWFEKNVPNAGGYYVVYKDGYTSYSPAKPFEEGYKSATMLENQHKKIKGYRDLSQAEIDLMNEVKAKAEEVGDLVHKIISISGEDDLLIDKRWASISKTDLQTGFMALVRSIARPESF